VTVPRQQQSRKRKAKESDSHDARATP
jgi:hypothetical protein